MITPAFISTSSLTDETRLSIARLQARLLDAQTELSTGRHADVGATLGASTGIAVSLRQDLNQIKTMKDTNSLVATRLTASQGALENISSGAQSYLADLVRIQSASASPDTIVAEAQAGMKTLTDQLNASVNGQFLFSGINSDVKPIDDYSSASSSNKQAIAAAFQAKFGMTQDDPNVVNISAADMSDFLDNEFAAQFTGTNWSDNWSSASDKVVRSRISRSETVDSSASANQPVFKDLMAAYTMMSDLGFTSLNDEAKQAVIKKAVQLVGNSIGGIGNVQSALGVAQERVTTANDNIDKQVNFLTLSIDNLESVDPSEVATRISLLQTQLEAAYQVTNRLSNLSLMDYLT